ncbi:MAG TPA: F0F1 ATP synthase subunit epsilon [Nocardioidaceae bacterium]|nr:F0F1 ATP synthase subunit epsilon [Nocardioidaceae bacterium]
MADLHVELVAADRKVWAGDARMIIAKTTDGDLGVLPGHSPLLGVLLNGTVQIKPLEGDGMLVAAVHSGFLSVADDKVSILAEVAELAGEIDVERAKAALERARALLDQDEDALAAAQRAETRIRAAGLAF